MQATILDRLTPSLIGDGPGNEDTVKDYHADVRTAVDYYPYGMAMPKRIFTGIWEDVESVGIGSFGLGSGSMKTAQPDTSQLPDTYGPQTNIL